MMKFNKFATAGTLLLAGAMGFAGCSSDDELANVNPTYDGKSVKAQFSINIPANTTRSRMTAGEAQETGMFLGMQNVKLVPMTLTGAETPADKAWTTVALANITSWDNGDIHAKVYNDVSFALGTNNILFYGESASTKSEGTLELKVGVDNTVGATTLELKTPYETTTVEANKTYLLGVLNAVDGVLDINAANTVVADLLNAFRGKKGIEYRVIAGSSQKILMLMTDLYNSVDAAKTADPANATTYDAILNKIKEYFTVDGTTLTYTLAQYANYPEDAKVPQGAVAVKFDSDTNKFVWQTESDVMTGFTMTNIDQYRKPAALYYFVNSSVCTMDSEWLKANIGTQTSWNNVVNAYSGGATEVLSSTRSVILKDVVQYGVADLKSTVKAGGTTLKDKNEQNIAIDGLTITGILIGGQKNVDWKFEPLADASEVVVYDGVYTEGTTTAPALTTAGTTTGNHTLLLQNTESTAVKVAIEFMNNSADFYGKDGMLISKGTKFYLIAELNPAGKTTTDLKSVFQQDYMTTANFTVTSLANAYSVVPDLRSPKLEFGLSVDLTWQTGMNFNVEFE